MPTLRVAALVLSLAVLASCANSAPRAEGSIGGNYGGFGKATVTSSPTGPTGPHDLAVDLTLTEAGARSRAPASDESRGRSTR